MKRIWQASPRRRQRWRGVAGGGGGREGRGEAGTGKWWERLRGGESNLSDRRQQGDIANLSSLTLRNLPKSGHLHGSFIQLRDRGPAPSHDMSCFLIHYYHSTATFICSTIQSFLQLPAASRILALAWRTRQKSEHLSTEARIVLNSEVYLVPHSETVLGPDSSGRLLAWKSAVVWHVQPTLFQIWNDPSERHISQLVT